LLAPMPSASIADTIQTVMSVEVKRSIATKVSVSETSSFRVKVQPTGVFLSDLKRVRNGHNLTFPRRGGHFRHACPHREGLCCVHWCLLRQCALESSPGGDFRESSGSISNGRDDSNSEAEKEEG
jgi:hypothetical protein